MERLERNLVNSVVLLVQRLALLVFCSSLAACGSGSGSGNGSDRDANVNDTTAPPPPLNSITVTDGPTLLPAPNEGTPLVAIVEMTTDEAAQPSIAISDGMDTTTVTFPDANTEHSLPVLGMMPNTPYTVTVTITDDGGTAKEVGSLNLTTPTVPELFPDVTVISSDPERMEPGYLLLDRIGRGQNADPALSPYSMILNQDGNVVWFSDLGDNGNLFSNDANLVFRSDRRVIKADLLGNIVDEIRLQDPGTALHHELHPTVNGTVISLSFQEETIDNYPNDLSSAEPRRTAAVRDEPVVEFDAETGELVNIWRMVDILDTSRVSMSGFTETDEGFDWVHGNAVFYDERDDSIIASFRHQDAVIKFDRMTGALRWILAPHANWSAPFQPFLLDPQGADFAWSYHQHAPMITAEGNLLLYDNGNFRASPYTAEMPLESEETYSRAVIYDIDEDAMTISQIWEYGKTHLPRIHTGFIGDADEMPETGNVVITFGGTGFLDGQRVGDQGYGQIVARIMEVTKTTPAEVVFEVQISDPEHWVSSYRSEHIPSLYPPDVIVTSE